MNRIAGRLGLTGMALVAGVAIYAQSPTTGLIQGKVVDGSGKAVAGAQVHLSGAAVQGTRTAVTDAEGNYRLPLVPVGQGFAIRVSSPAGTAEGKNLQIEPWKTHVFNFTARKATEATAVVVVTATANQVDTATVVDSKTYTAETLQTLPIAGRDYMSATYLTPGVVDGGRGAANPNIAGSTAFENNYIVDGLNVTDPFLGQNNTRINTLAVDSVQVQTGGFEPEYGRALGGVISVVTKTGSNEFHGDVELTYQPSSSIAKVETTDLPYYSQRPKQGNSSTVALWVGGPLLKDKIWYSLGYSTSTDQQLPSYGRVYFFDPILGVTNPRAVPAGSAGTPALPAGVVNNGSSYDLKDTTGSLTSKFTFSPNQDHTFELAINSNRRTADTRLQALSFTNWASTYKAHQNVDTASFNWRATWTPTWLTDVRVGTYKRKSFNDTNAAYMQSSLGFSIANAYYAGSLNSDGSQVFPGVPARAYGATTGGGNLADQTTDITRQQMTIKGSNFLGDHVIKYGLDIDNTKDKQFSRYTGDFYITRSARYDAITGAFVRFDDTYRFRMGAKGHPVYNTNGTLYANSSVLFNGDGLDLEAKTKNLAYFLQDTWQITPEWLIVFGVRIDSQKVFGGDGQEYINFKPGDMTAPRFGITYNPGGTGKTKLSASFGRFYETIPMDLNLRAGSIEGFFSFSRRYSGAAAQNNVFWLPSLDQLWNTSTWWQRGADASLGAGNPSSNRVIGGEKSVIQDGIKPQSINEIGLGVEHQITDLWKAAAKWKYRYYNHVVEDYSFDFGSTYVLGNPGQGGLGSVPVEVVDYDYPGQRDFLVFPKPRRDYRELVLTLDKAKGGDRWAFNSSFTFASNWGNFAGLDEPLTGQSDPNITAVFDLPTLMKNTTGTLPNTPRYNFQAYGTWDFGSGVTAGLRFLYRAGVAISATGPDLGYLYGPNNPSSGPSGYYALNGQLLHEGNYLGQYALLEPRGSRGATPDVTRFDLHLEWQTKLFATAKATLFLDIFNLFNQQMVLTVNQSKATGQLVEGALSNAFGTVIDPTDTTLGYVAMDNPYFLRPTSRQAPRSLQFGVRVNF